MVAFAMMAFEIARHLFPRLGIRCKMQYILVNDRNCFTRCDIREHIGVVIRLDKPSFAGQLGVANKLKSLND